MLNAMHLSKVNYCIAETIGNSMAAKDKLDDEIQMKVIAAPIHFPDPPSVAAPGPPIISSPLTDIEKELPIPFDRKIMINARNLCRSLVDRHVSASLIRRIPLLPITIGHANIIANTYNSSPSAFRIEMQYIAKNLQSVINRWLVATHRPCPYSADDVEAMEELVARMDECISSQDQRFPNPLLSYGCISSQSKRQAACDIFRCSLFILMLLGFIAAMVSLIWWGVRSLM